MQQRCSLLDNKLKEIEGVDDLGSVDPRELSLVPDVVIPPKFKCRNLKSTVEPNALRTIWPRIGHKMMRYFHNEDLLNHAGGHSKNRTILKDEVQTLIGADLTRFRRTCRWPPKVLRYSTN